MKTLHKVTLVTKQLQPRGILVADFPIIINRLIINTFIDIMLSKAG